MKTVILMRHGKSSWDYDVSDKDRPLKERGINDAHMVGKTFMKNGIQIDFAYSSPANRALHTCMIFLRNIGFNLDDFQVTEELYDFSGQDVKRFIQNLDNKLDTVVLFGHNYAYTNLANALGDQYIENVPTSGLVQIEFDVSEWSKVSKGTTQQLIFPKHLKQ